MAVEPLGPEYSLICDEIENGLFSILSDVAKDKIKEWVLLAAHDGFRRGEDAGYAKAIGWGYAAPEDKFFSITQEIENGPFSIMSVCARNELKKYVRLAMTDAYQRGRKIGAARGGQPSS